MTDPIADAAALLHSHGYTVTPPLPAFAPGQTWGTDTEASRITRIDGAGIWSEWLRHPTMTRPGAECCCTPAAFRAWVMQVGAEVVV